MLAHRFRLRYFAGLFNLLNDRTGGYLVGAEVAQASRWRARPALTVWASP